jgi:hypothetical protein
MWTHIGDHFITEPSYYSLLQFITVYTNLFFLRFDKKFNLLEVQKYYIIKSLLHLLTLKKVKILKKFQKILSQRASKGKII